MIIKKFKGEIKSIIDLSKTAKEIKIALSEPIDFEPGCFVNLFLDIGNEKVRRAYSISSPSNDRDNITLTIRLSPNGLLTPIFWNKNMTGTHIELMGPLGLNTVDKMKLNKVYLFAFGVGTGVVKSIADHFSKVEKLEKLVIITGSRSEDEILYKEYFNSLAENSDKISVMRVVSKLPEGSNIPRGYIQDHIDGLDFNNSDVYVCGQEKACNDLITKIKSTNPNGCNYFIEGFH